MCDLVTLEARSTESEFPTEEDLRTSQLLAREQAKKFDNQNVKGRN